MGEKKGVDAKGTTKEVLESGASAAAFAGISFLTQPQKVFGANDRVRVGICGLRGQGFFHAENYAMLHNVEIAAFCDPDANILRGRLADLALMAVPPSKTYSDVRKMLEDKSIDCVSIATPNHWHSLIGIWACQAGKDVYVELDVARWGLGVGFPNRASALGGHFMFDDDQETPNTLSCIWEFDQPDGKRKLLEFEVRHWMTNHEADIRTPGFGIDIPGFLGPPKSGAKRRLFARGAVGDIFYGSKGYMATTDAGALQIYRTWLGEEQENGPRGTRGEGNSWANFIDCVRSRKRENLLSPIDEGHISCTLVHLANASYRLGRSIRFDPATQQVIGDEEASKLLRGSYREPFVVREEV